MRYCYGIGMIDQKLSLILGSLPVDRKEKEKVAEEEEKVADVKVVGSEIWLPEWEFGFDHLPETGIGIPEVGFYRILEFRF